MHSPLERLHMDVVITFTPSSMSGFKYILTIVDQYSSYKFCQFLQEKLDVLSKFEVFAKIVENLHDAKIKEIVSDGGGEFFNSRRKNFAISNGINHIFSPPVTPEHNEYAERAKKTFWTKLGHSS